MRTLPKTTSFWSFFLADPVRRCQFSSLLAMNMVWEPWEILWCTAFHMALRPFFMGPGGLCPHLVFAPSLGESEAGFAASSLFPGMWNTCITIWLPPRNITI